MVRIGALIIIGRVTSGTVGRRPGISGYMAIDASRLQMGSGQWKLGFVVIKTIGCATGRVTGQAG